MKWPGFLQFTPDERKAVLALALFTAGGGLVLEVGRRHPEWTPGVRALPPATADSGLARISAALPDSRAAALSIPPREEASDIGASRNSDGLKVPHEASGLLGRGEAPDPPVREPRAPTAPASEPPNPAAQLVDLNQADQAALESLPGIGPAMARRIVEDRAAQGPYARPEDLLRVKGIGPATLRRLLPLVRVSP